MNSKKMKLIRRRAKELLVEWMQSLVDKESGKAYNVNNVLGFTPKQTHLYYNDGTFHLSSFTYKWFVKRLKKLCYTKDLSLITVQDCKEMNK